MKQQSRRRVVTAAATFIVLAVAGCRSQLPTGQTIMTADAAPDSAPTADAAMMADAASEPADRIDTAVPDRAKADSVATASLFMMIDDMETDPTGSPSGHFLWKKVGNWFSSTSASVAGLPLADVLPVDIVPPRGTSKRARHVKGSKLEDGLNTWAQLDHPSGTPVDLSAYAGISVWLRSAGRDQPVFVAVRDKETLAGQPLNDIFSGTLGPSPWFAQRLNLVGDRWQHFVLLFDDFRQDLELVGGTTTRALDTAAVTSIDFQTGVGSAAFDLWIDDLALRCRGSCPE